MRRFPLAWLRRPVRVERADAGSAVLEMAIALPVYLLTVFGFCQCALMLFTYLSTTYACRNCARYASLHSTASLAPATATQMTAMVQSELYLSPAMSPSIQVLYLNPSTGATATNTVGNLVEVSASWSQTVKIPWMSSHTFTVATQGYQIITR